MTMPTKGEEDAKKKDEDAIPFEVVQAALDRHNLAEAELVPLERTLLQIRNTTENMWKNAPSMPNEGGVFIFFANLDKQCIFGPSLQVEKLLGPCFHPRL